MMEGVEFGFVGAYAPVVFEMHLCCNVRSKLWLLCLDRAIHIEKR